jgi:aspartyl aminopeptidase
LLATVLERIALELGQTRSAHLAALAGSLMISADMAHAVHPNYADRHEPRHKPQLGQGPVLKTNHNQRYATNAASAAAIRRLAQHAGVPLQDFVARTDLGCGSTIGPITAASLGIAVADVGTPMLSMHSARECAATADHAPFIALMTAHLRG